MRALFWLIFLAALATALVVFAHNNESYVLLVFPTMRAELSFSLFAILMVLGVAILYFVMRIIDAFISMPARARAYQARLSAQRAAKDFSESVRYLMEGRYRRAISAATGAWRHRHAPGIAALIALRASSLLRDPNGVALWHGRAELHEQENAVARRMVEAEGFIAARDYQGARRILQELGKRGARHIAALRLLLRVEQGEHNWSEMLRLTNLLEKHKGLSAEQASAIRSHVHDNIIEGISDVDSLMRYYHQQPRSDRLAPHFVQHMARCLRNLGEHATALRIIETTLEDEWNSDLAGTYGEAPEVDTLTRIARCEDWLSAHPRDPELLLTLGRLCLAQQLWGKAQSYLEASLSIRPARVTYLQLASLNELLERPNIAHQYYRAAARF